MLVSICIPTYNQVKYLRKTIDSILSQSFQDVEILISDDSSNNDVYDLIHEYKQVEDKIVYFRNSPSLGSPENWNHAMSKAKGKFIKIMHHDDWFVVDDALEKLVLCIQDNPNSLVFAGIKGEIVHEQRSYVNCPSQNVLNKIKTDPFTLIWGNFIGPPSTIIFPNIDIQFDKSLLWLVDIEFYLNLILNHNLKLEFVDEVLFENITDDHNITNQCFQNKKLELKEFSYIFKKYFPKASVITRLMFLRKLKKHIETYAEVSWFELISYHIKK